MNIISNDCLGGFIYNNVLKAEYTTPFIWNRIWNDDFLYLVDNLENIDFTKYELLPTTENTFHLRIDNKIDVWYNHYIQDDNCKTPITGINDEHNTWLDVKYYKIKEYLLEKYNNRLARFSPKNENVIAVQDSGKSQGKVDINKLIKICKKHNYKLVLQTNQEITEKYDKLYLTPFIQEKLFYLVDDEKYKKELKEFLEK